MTDSYPVMFTGGPKDGAEEWIATLHATIPNTSAGQRGVYRLTTTACDGRHVYEWGGIL